MTLKNSHVHLAIFLFNFISRSLPRCTSNLGLFVAFLISTLYTRHLPQPNPCGDDNHFWHPNQSQIDRPRSQHPRIHAFPSQVSTKAKCSSSSIRINFLKPELFSLVPIRRKLTRFLNSRKSCSFSYLHVTIHENISTPVEICYA